MTVLEPFNEDMIIVDYFDFRHDLQHTKTFFDDNFWGTADELRE